MSQVQQLNINLDGIGSVIKSKKFRVPAYQRSYAWETDHVDALLNDIRDALTNKEKEYFLGSIVLTSSSNGRFEVIDGQQRLTTVSLIISAIKNIFRSFEDNEAVISIQQDFLSKTDRRTKEKESKIILNETDNDIYQQMIDDIYDYSDKKKIRRMSHKRLIECYEFCCQYLSDLCGKSRDAEDLLHSWLDYIEENLKIIVVTAPDDSNAFVIFETLNDRGLELAISDLVKNYLFHRSGDKLEEAKNRWLSMVAVLESSADDPLIVTYIRHFTMSKYGLIREKELFNFLKKKISTKNLALKFSNELYENVQAYSALINIDHEFWSKFEISVKTSIETLNLLGMTQIRPLLIAILNNFENKQITLSFKKLVSIAVRYQIVGGVGGGSLEKLYSDTAKQITEKSIKNTKELLLAFKNVPSDVTFRDGFAIASVSKQRIARYYLRELEKANAQDNQVIVTSDVLAVNSEHVLPQNTNEYWDSIFNADEQRSYTNRLGNIALLSSTANSSIGNENFESKKIIFASSPFYFTKIISDEENWNKDSIEKRQRMMADVAVKHWSI